MNEAEVNPIRLMNMKKLLIIIFSVVGLAAIITILAIVFVNIRNSGGLDGGSG